METSSFIKCSSFQAFALYASTLIIFGEAARKGGVFNIWAPEMPEGFFNPASASDLDKWGSGLPTTTDCGIRYGEGRGSGLTSVDEQYNGTDWYALDEGQCWALSTHIAGHRFGNYVNFYILIDLGICHGIDIVCVGWWIGTLIVSRFVYYQRDLNKIYEGVDFKPYLRYQLLLKYVFVGALMNHVDGPRLMNFWVAFCFWTCYELERFCFVKYYRKMPIYNMDFMNAITNWCMPGALICHMFFSFFTFGVSYTTVQEHPEDTDDTYYIIFGILHMIGWSDLKYRFNIPVIRALGIYWVLSAAFIIAYLLPLKIWDFGTGESYGCGTQVKRRAQNDPNVYGTGFDTSTLPDDLSYTDAVQAVDDLKCGRENVLNKICRIEVQKYIPDPTKREFGLIFVN